MYAVRQREREIAVRIAVGADPRQITRLFVMEGSRVMLAGLALGLLAAVGAGRALESQLFGVPPVDPLTLLTTTAGFALAGYLAVWWPARRAAAHRLRPPPSRKKPRKFAGSLADNTCSKSTTRVVLSVLFPPIPWHWRSTPVAPSHVYGAHAV